MKTAKNYNSKPLLLFVVSFVHLAVFNVTTLQGQNLKEFELQKTQIIDSTLINLEENNKNQILSLIPNISYNFNTGINIGFNLSSFVQFKQTKIRNKIELNKLKIQQMENLKNEIKKAEIEEMEILSSAKAIEFELSILKEKFELYKLYFLQYQNNEIPYSNYTSSKISYLESFKSSFLKISNLELKVEKFKKKYNYKPLEIENLLKTAKNYKI